MANKAMILRLLVFAACCGSISLAWADKPPSTLPAVTGSILCAYWREYPGTHLADLTSLPAYPNFPNEQVYLDHFEIPEDQEGNFGTLIRGYLHAPQTGNYTFHIASNNQSELWLSPDDNPAHIQRIAAVSTWSMPHDWTADPQQQSQPISLKAGHSYYIEARHKNGGGDNNLAVAWKLPNGEMEAPIPGQHLSPAPPVIVPAPKLKLPTLPTTPGDHRLKIQVDYLTQHVSLPLRLTLPNGYHPGDTYSALVFLPDTDQPPDNAGYYLQGPDRLLDSNPSPQQTYRFIGISPQCPPGRDYEQRITIQAIAAAVSQLCRAYLIDPHHIALSGSGAGGTAIWRLAAQMPGYFHTLAPINGLQVHDKQLLQRLAGCRIHIITDIAKGYCTECANRMNRALAKCDPKPEVIYLGAKELSGGGAADYCFAQPAFYAWLLDQEPPAMHSTSRGLWRSDQWHWLPGTVFLLALIYFWQYGRRQSERDTKEPPPIEGPINDDKLN